MTTASDFEQSCRDKITVLFLAEILNRLGVIAAGKVLTNVTKKVDAEENEEVKTRLLSYIEELKETYVNDPDNPPIEGHKWQIPR